MPDKTPQQLRNDHAQTFKRFWQAYPRHTHQHEAALAWGRLMEDGEDPVQLVKAAEGYANTNPDLKFVTAPHNWLKTGRYEDADLFSDEAAASVEWLRRMYRTCNVAAVESKMQRRFPKWYPSRDDLTDTEERAEYKAAAHAWILEIHKEYFATDV